MNKANKVVAQYLSKLVGKTVTSVVIDDHPETLADFGSPLYGLQFSGGLRAYILCDPEGNGPGWLAIEPGGAEMDNTTRLISSHGHVDFNSEFGFVRSTDLDSEFGDPPIWVNVFEWRARYPGETLGNDEHDILDFGYVDAKGVYSPPCDDWRDDREPARRDEL